MLKSYHLRSHAANQSTFVDLICINSRQTSQSKWHLNILTFGNKYKSTPMSHKSEISTVCSSFSLFKSRCHLRATANRRDCVRSSLSQHLCPWELPHWAVESMLEQFYNAVVWDRIDYITVQCGFQQLAPPKVSTLSLVNLFGKIFQWYFFSDFC